MTRGALCVGLWALVALAGCAQAPRASDPGAAIGEGQRLFERANVVVHERTPEEWVGVLDEKQVPVPPIEMGDASMPARFVEEGTQRSRVMEFVEALSKDLGPRLTGSRNLERAERWAMQQFRAFGATNVHLQPWGTIGLGFDRGPSSGAIYVGRVPRPPANQAGSASGAAPAAASGVAPAAASATAPAAAPGAEPKLEWTKSREVELSALSWSIGTDGPVRGRVLREPQTEEEFNAVKDQLRGAWILLQAPPPIGQRGVRSMVAARYEMRREARKKVSEGKSIGELPLAERLAFEPVAGYISTSRDERVWTGPTAGWRDLSWEDRDQFSDDQPHVQIRLSDYDYLNSRLTDKENVEVEFNLPHTFRRGPIPQYNVIAEIRGSKRPDEYVLVSGHLDSWDGPGSQGTIDNATGCAVTIEAARILLASGARPDRTIRFVLWSGEEQGLLGARGYVETNKDDLPRISAMFNDDGGTGYQAGIPAAGVMVDLLVAATAPTNNVFYSNADKKFLNVNIRNTGETLRTHSGSDHAAFNAVGVPGFFWDEGGRADYPFGWHTQNDRVNLAIEEYLMQSAVNSAITAYRLACAPTLLPRPEKKADGSDRPNMLPRPGTQSGDRAAESSR